LSDAQGIPGVCMRPKRILRFEMADSPALDGPRACVPWTEDRPCVVVDSLARFKLALTVRPYDAILCINGMPRPDALGAMETAHAACPQVAFLFLTPQAADAWEGSLDRGGLPFPPIAGPVAPMEAKALREAHERLRRDQGNLRALLENSGDPMLSLDLDFRVMAYNSRASLLALKLTGHPLSHGCAFLEHLEEPRREIWRRIGDRIKAGESFRQEFTLQVQGRPLILDVVLSPVLDNGVLSGIAIAGRDLTQARESERRHREKENRDALEILHSRDRLEAEGIKNAAGMSGSLDLRILDRLRLLSEGDEGRTFQDLVCGFLEQSMEKVVGLGKFAEIRDFPSLAKAAHGLKGLSLNFGALAMTRKCDALQSAAEAGGKQAVVEALAGLKDALTDTRIAFSRLPGLDGREWMRAKPAPDMGGIDAG
jgi:PAS domain S-box-containing protein